MSNWNTARLTTKGLALLSKLAAGSALTVTRILAGAGMVPEGELRDQTAVTDPKQQLSQLPIEIHTGAQAEIPVLLKNTGVTEGYTAHQIGVFALDPDGGEVLLFLAQDTAGEEVPAEADSLLFSLSFTFRLQLGNASPIILETAPQKELTYGEAGKLLAPIGHVDGNILSKDGIHGLRYDETEDVFEVYDKQAGAWGPIAVGAPKLQEIAVTAPPVKTAYHEGEFFTPDGMVVTAGYTQEISTPVTGYRILPDRPLKASDNHVTVSYTANGITKTARQAISVRALLHISITTPPKTTLFLYGSRFDPAGMVVRAAYAGGSTRDVTASCVFSPSKPLQMTDTAVIVSYTAGDTTVTDSLPISVVRKLLSISIQSPPDKTAYVEGEPFAPTGMIVRAGYHDGAYKTIREYTVLPQGPLSVSDTAVTVRYTENGITHTAAQPITVAPKPQIAYYGNSMKGTLEPLRDPRHLLKAAHVGGYAVFAGGYANVTDAYDDTLVHLSPPDMRDNKSNCAAAELDEYALFCGGMLNTTTINGTVDAYDSTLTRFDAAYLSSGRYGHAGTSNGTHAVFAGGSPANATIVATADAYDSTLTRRPLGMLSYERAYLAATSVGFYMLFGGGIKRGTDGIMDTVDAYNRVLVRTSAPAMTEARYLLAAASTGHYALFAGGSYLKDTIEVYDEYLLRLTPLTMPDNLQESAGTSKDGYAIFGGGLNGAVTTGTVAVYDDTLTRIAPKDLSVARGSLAATHVGDYALFGGGVSNNTSNASAFCNTVDVYTITP